MAKKERSAVSGYGAKGSLDLRASRQRKGVTLEEIAERTKISIRFLRAIEAGDFDQLPGGIFATSYLRQYAAQTGIKESDILAYYQRKTFRAVETQEPVRQDCGSGSVKTTLIRMWLGSFAGGR